MASYTKQAKDESLQYLAMRARAIRAGAIRTRTAGSPPGAFSNGTHHR